MSTEEEKQLPTDIKQKKKPTKKWATKNIILIFVIVLLAAGAVAGIGYYITRKKKAPIIYRDWWEYSDEERKLGRELAREAARPMNQAARRVMNQK